MLDKVGAEVEKYAVCHDAGNRSVFRYVHGVI